ncbi:hypothetical protein GCM10007368_00140 [Isoptericola cucumis]|uniref:Uncharacterized protein n=1 Tax=Isoptericola cucumis TaxID=1776856 RepID=A0ABQ2B2D3_9MICO|nr:hypothetical protein GCM10007368_00140 [Isoptericola cucumis]
MACGTCGRQASGFRDLAWRVVAPAAFRDAAIRCVPARTEDLVQGGLAGAAVGHDARQDQFDVGRLEVRRLEVGCVARDVGPFGRSTVGRVASGIRPFVLGRPRRRRAREGHHERARRPGYGAPRTAQRSVGSAGAAPPDEAAAG